MYLIYVNKCILSKHNNFLLLLHSISLLFANVIFSQVKHFSVGLCICGKQRFE